MAPLQDILILDQKEDTSVQVPHLLSAGECHIWPRVPGLTLLFMG